MQSSHISAKAIKQKNGSYKYDTFNSLTTCSKSMDILRICTVHLILSLQNSRFPIHNAANNALVNTLPNNLGFLLHMYTVKLKKNNHHNNEFEIIFSNILRHWCRVY